METKLQKAVEEAVRFQKEKEHLQEELHEKERQANSQELVRFTWSLLFFVILFLFPYTVMSWIWIFLNFCSQTMQMLKQTCTMLEGQVEELEVMNDEYQDRETQWNMIKY